MKTKVYFIAACLVNLAFSSACSEQQNSDSATRDEGDVCAETAQCKTPLVCQNERCQRLCNSDEDCDILSQHCEDSICKSGSAITCGNSKVEHGEACDDGNNENGDGCSSTCVIEPGYYCSGTISICHTYCGNGQEDTGEACDDGNNENGDGCSSKCNVEENYTCKSWPSECACSEGYQDVNNDGLCTLDCAADCDQRCYYLADGSASCGCPAGQQDSNSDGRCQADCVADCPHCYYWEDGSATCGCHDGEQDNDGDGQCQPTCATALASGALNCGNFTGCSDESGTAQCICAMYVAPDGSGNGSTWADASSDLSTVLDKVSSVMQLYDYASCNIWVAAGDYNQQTTVNLVSNVNIFGGFAKGAVSISDRVLSGTSVFDFTAGLTAGQNTLFKADSVNNIILSGLTITSTKFLTEDELRGIEVKGIAFNCNNSEEIAFDHVVARDNLMDIAPDVDEDERYMMMMMSYGPFYLYKCTMEITDSTFEHNGTNIDDDRLEGGALAIMSSKVVIRDSQFRKNIAGNAGGAIYNNSSELYLYHDLFEQNSATGGGALYGPVTRADDCLFAGNNSPSSGGGVIWAFSGLITNSQFIANKASSWGGAIHAHGGRLEKCIFCGNITRSSYGILYNESGTLELVNSFMVGNYAHTNISADGSFSKNDGRLFMGFYPLALLYVTVADNTARNPESELFGRWSGGTNKYDNATMSVYNSLFFNNGRSLLSTGVSPVINSIDAIDEDTELHLATVQNNSGTWTAASYDALSNLTRLAVAGEKWAAGALKQAFVFPDINSTTNVAFPIYDNGADYLLVRGNIADYGCFKMATTTNDELYGAEPVTAEDVDAHYDLSGKSFVIRRYDLTAASTQAVDQAAVIDGVTDDFYGHARGVLPDIGAVEFNP